MKARFKETDSKSMTMGKGERTWRRGRGPTLTLNEIQVKGGSRIIYGITNQRKEACEKKIPSHGQEGGFLKFKRGVFEKGGF